MKKCSPFITNIHLIVVRPVRRLVIIVLLTCSSSLFGQTWSGSGPHRPATESYLSRVGTIIFGTLGAELNKHPERLSGKVKAALRLDRGGHVQVQKILSSTSNQWVQDTTLRVVSHGEATADAETGCRRAKP